MAVFAIALGTALVIFGALALRLDLKDRTVLIRRTRRLR
jgi:hypothetical protein